jgi:hypothetical protein
LHGLERARRHADVQRGQRHVVRDGESARVIQRGAADLCFSGGRRSGRSTLWARCGARLLGAW